MAAPPISRPLTGLGLRSALSLLSTHGLDHMIARPAIRVASRSMSTQRGTVQPQCVRPGILPVSFLARPASISSLPQKGSYSTSQPPKPPADTETSPKSAPQASTPSRPPPPPPPISPADFDFYDAPPKPSGSNSADQASSTKAAGSEAATAAAQTSVNSSSSTIDATSTSAKDSKLPSSIKSKSSPLAESLSSFMDRAQTTLFTASQRINDLTGYSGIETLKSRITDLENSLDRAQTHLHDTRVKYKAAVAERAATQREITTLLARQKTWTPLDFERFTTLYRQDYEHEASVADNASALEEAEREAERLNRELSSGILARYHEEQIWSDKIRRMSTWGTWGLMAVNIFLFLVLQFGAEPWRRKRLVRGFEEKVREALENEREHLHTTVLSSSEPVVVTRRHEPEPTLVAQAEPEKAVPASSTDEKSASPATAEYSAAASDAADHIIKPARPPSAPVSLAYLMPASWNELVDSEHWRMVFAELASERPVALQMKELTRIALQGVATGAAAATCSFMVFFMLFKTS